VAAGARVSAVRKKSRGGREHAREREERIGERGGVIGASLSPRKGNSGGVHLLSEDRRHLRGHAGASCLEEDDGQGSWVGPQLGFRKERRGQKRPKSERKPFFL
jgi:hypothetical protein